MNHFFAYLFRMKYIRRWGLMRNSMDENLEEHSLEVAMLAHCLALIRRDVLGKPCDPDRVAAAALYHDVAETLTGDLPTPVKYINDEFRESYRRIEEASRVKLLEMLPQELRASYETLMADCESDPEIFALVKAADRLSAYIKCIGELNTGNREFQRASLQTKEALDSMKLPEVDYFYEHFLESFRLSLHDMGEI